MPRPLWYSLDVQLHEEVNISKTSPCTLSLNRERGNRGIIHLMTKAELTKSLLIAAPINKVWNVVTSPASISKWMLEEEMSVESEWEVGSPIVFKRNLYKVVYDDKGAVLKIEKEKIFQYSHWSKVMRLPDVPENYSIITFTFEPKNNNTILTVKHLNLIAETAYEHANFYWNTALYIIKKMSEAL